LSKSNFELLLSPVVLRSPAGMIIGAPPLAFAAFAQPTIPAADYRQNQPGSPLAAGQITATSFPDAPNSDQSPEQTSSPSLTCFSGHSGFPQFPWRHQPVENNRFPSTRFGRAARESYG
jgi:hypothetical protein